MTEVLRLLVAAVFAVAGAAKLLDREGSRRAARAFGAPGWIGMALPVVELGIAVALVPSSTARAAAIAGAALLAVFSVAMANALLRGRTADCGCLGKLYSSQASWWTIARNVALVAMALAIASQPARALDWVEVAIAGVAIALVAQAIFAVTVLRRYGRALARIEALEARPEDPAPSPVTASENRMARLALGGMAASAVAATATVAQAASNRSSALDPELQAIDAAFKAGLQRLVAASDRSSKAVHAYATTRRDAKLRATKSAVAVRALAAERREVLALRGRIKALAATGDSARNVRQRLLAGLSLMANSVDHHRRALSADPQKAASLLATSQRLRVDSLVPFATAATIVRNER